MIWSRRDPKALLVPIFYQIRLPRVLSKPGLEHLQGSGILSFSGVLVSVIHHPYGEEFLPNF